MGIISSAALTRSEVILLGDPRWRISARVEKAGVSGIIIGGASPVDSTLVTMSYLSGGGVLKPGQAVLTSGMAMLPKDIPIGQIAEDARTAEQGMAEVRVKLGANPGALEEVWVLTQ